jgi:protein O-GlcNAc transferase
MGADYVQYLIADQVACPPKYEKYYSERFLYMPHSFLANSFAYMQPELVPPAAALPADDNPAVNRCGLPASKGASASDGPATFVYCNFNKHLKFDPELFADWLRTLQQVPGALLCLLENPADSIQHIAEFVADFDPSLSGRVDFLPFMANPFDNQRRSARYCHAVLDTTVYNGHTTAVDALYGAVPVVTRGDQKDMGTCAAYCENSLLVPCTSSCCRTLPSFFTALLSHRRVYHHSLTS